MTIRLSSLKTSCITACEYAGAVPRTSAYALNNAFCLTLEIADKAG